MKLLWLLLLLITNQVLGQFALIKDNDGFANIRSSAGSGDNIVDSLKTGDVVWCFDTEGSWVYIDYRKNGKIASGYVHKTRVIYVNSFDSIPLIKHTGNSVTLRKDSLTITVTEMNFDTSKNKLTYEKGTGYTYLSKINGKSFWGTDGNIPRRKYKSITIKKGEKNISIPGTEIENLYDPNLDYTQCYYNKEKDALYLMAENGDAAGAYAVLWILVNGKFKNKILIIPF